MTCISRISFILRNSIHSNSYKCVIQSRHLKTPSPIFSMILGTDLSLEKKIKFLQHDSVSLGNVSIPVSLFNNCNTKNIPKIF